MRIRSNLLSLGDEQFMLEYFPYHLESNNGKEHSVKKAPEAKDETISLVLFQMMVAISHIVKGDVVKELQSMIASELGRAGLPYVLFS